MNRLFSSQKKEKKNSKQNSQEKTIDSVVKDKEAERRRLEEDEKEFMRKKSERERKIIQIEKEELEQREEEVRKRNYNLEEVRRGHRSIEDRLEQRVKELQMELEDRRLDHSSIEQALERDLAGKMEVIRELRDSVKRRMEQFGDIDMSSSLLPPVSIPSSMLPSLSTSPSLYTSPTYPSLSTSPTAPFMLDIDQVDSRQESGAETERPSGAGETVLGAGGRSGRETEGKEEVQKRNKPSSWTGSMTDISQESKNSRLDRCRSLARGEVDAVSILYPEVPTDEPGLDQFETLKRPGRRVPVMESVD